MNNENGENLALKSKQATIFTDLLQSKKVNLLVETEGLFNLNESVKKELKEEDPTRREKGPLLGSPNGKFTVNL
jgi:hypothetical protein